MNEEEQKNPFNISLPMLFDVPANVLSRYATNIVVQGLQHEFVLSFFEAQPPILLGSPEENKAKYEKLGAIPAVCVGKIIVAADQLPTFIEALQTALTTYQASTENQEN